MTSPKAIVAIFLLVYLPAFSYLAYVGVREAIPLQAILFLTAVLGLGELARRVVTKATLPKVVLGSVGGVLGLFWIVQTIRRILFIVSEGGMERSDGQGSPLMFLVGAAAEFLILGLPALGLLLLAASRPSRPADADLATRSLQP